jgi:hypothetical protein
VVVFLPRKLGFLKWGGAFVVINGPWSLPHYWESVLWAHLSHPSQLLHLSHERGRELCTGRASGVCWEQRSSLSLAAHAMRASLCLGFRLVFLCAPATCCSTYTHVAVGASLLRMVNRSLSDPLCTLERVCLVWLLLCRPVFASTPPGRAMQCMFDSLRVG